MSQKTGFLREQQAKDYLIAQGLEWVSSNYHCRLGEIDLIMRDRAHLVFVEVRARASMAFGGAAASVNASKRQKLLKTASFYLLTHSLQDQQPIRFDVLCMDGVPPSMHWIKNAFGSDY